MGILSRYFSTTDLTEIKLAVQEAEKKTSGEIVPYFAEASHHYKEWNWFGSFIGGGLGGFVLFLMDQFGFKSWDYGALDSVVFVWSGAFIGYILPYFLSGLRLTIVPFGAKKFFVNLKSKEAFLEEEVFRTSNRTGILIYISLREKMVRILPDTAIAKIVPQSDWEEAVRLIVQGMKSNQKKEGIVASVLFCGNLLVKYGLHIQKDDKNEISDEIRDGGTQL
ncbi:TPM domain-containing protein [Leptospira sp. 'Mane']|uniref:TPM domain-containing protein n=1 Tax=Leptospira sp. 'Mane' TaxID=3387407 RepID=UPI00398B4EEA